MKNKKGLTLLEMLVVIGIIGILAAVLLSLFGGATDSAKAAKCMNNMRSLAVGVINTATSEGSGYYPPAKSFKYRSVASDGSLRYPRIKGWISWTSAGDQMQNGEWKSKAEGSTIYLGDATEENVLYALTNGAIWTAVGRARDSYTCPVHADLFKKKNGRQPGWSYVMNARFGIQDGYWYVETSRKNRTSKQMGSVNISGRAENPIAPDKVLLFAEVPALTITGGSGQQANPDLSGLGEAGDAILKSAEGEVIGFNHKISGGKYVGHVAFADGHVDKLTMPTSGSLTELTKWLCDGYDVRFDGRQYTKVSE